MDYIKKIREEKPFIFNITNEVAANFVANGLLAIGASPAVSHNPKEASENGANADAVLLNLGSLTVDRGKAMLKAGKAASENKVPVILDPVAVGSTTFRTELIHELLRTIDISVIRANAGEIAFLAGVLHKSKGPDSMLEVNDPTIAQLVARKYNAVVISTGETDVITDGSSTVLCKNGHKMLENITASGCLLSSYIAPFLAVSENVLQASIYATSSYNIAAELAMKKAAGPGTFIPALLDEIYFLTDEKVSRYKKVEVL